LLPSLSEARSIGATSWWQASIKDRDSFNVTIGTLFRIDSGPDGSTRFSTATIINQADTILHPINALLFVQTTNKQSFAANIVGFSLESSNDSWWPTWTKLCRVDLRNAQILWLSDTDVTTLIGAEVFETKAMAAPIAPMQPISGWTAWECPKGKTCDLKKLRVGISDAAGTVSWQVKTDPPISPDLLPLYLKIIGPVKLANVRNVSSCVERR
jgi:hypothetical protein